MAGTQSEQEDIALTLEGMATTLEKVAKELRKLARPLVQKKLEEVK